MASLKAEFRVTACLLAFLPACLPACLPSCLLAWISASSASERNSNAALVISDEQTGNQRTGWPLATDAPPSFLSVARSGQGQCQRPAYGESAGATDKRLPRISTEQADTDNRQAALLCSRDDVDMFRREMAMSDFDISVFLREMSMPLTATCSAHETDAESRRRTSIQL
ncbi:hypothetical protein BZA05DRAFT_418194 [Tricharina praecox]|uniref:uncharacterized protein n=1 Tax=Tricharina praecox TaxID=43433 RepID=UPI002220A2EE|nr:uncharacterized protein BZA05DRAFT_418194 [Tricharina praecox]KAI5853395.1 hypothetical protein BZA05DRAFT_418194 [Tricharina praecox]